MPDKKGRQSCYMPDKLVFPILRQSSGLCLSSLFFEHIVRPQCCKSRFFLTKNCILEPREPRSEDKQGVLLGVTHDSLPEIAAWNKSFFHLI